MEDKVYTFALQEPQISIQVPGIAVVVLARAKLQGVDEDTHHQEIAVGPGQTDEREVAFMEIAHRWNKTDALT
jgi:hypothetical protein